MPDIDGTTMGSLQVMIRGQRQGMRQAMDGGVGRQLCTSLHGIIDATEAGC